MKPGIYDISDVDYQGDRIGDVPSLSASIAKILCNETPLHAWTAHPRLNPNFVREDKQIFDLGTVAHALMLQGESVAIVLDVDDWRTKAAQEAKAMAYAEKRIPILRKHWDRIQAMVAAGKAQLAAHKEAKNAFSDGKPEQTLVWVDDYGVQCRARLDWLHDSRLIIDDYKTTGMSVNPERLGRAMEAMGNDIQSAFYLRGLKKLFGVTAQFRFIYQEDFPPHAVSVVGVGPDFQWSGEWKVQQAIDLWAKCLSENKWPGYTDRIAYPTLPAWAAGKIEEDQLRSVGA